MRKTALLLSALALTAVPLAACTSASEDAPAPEPAPVADTPEPSDGGTDEYAEEPAEEPSADAETLAEDAVIPAGAVTDPPQQVGEFSLQDGSGPAHMYSHAEESILIGVDSTVLSTDYETLVEEIATDNTPAGTGSCGTNEAGTSIVCYLRTEDGVITVTAIPSEISLEDTVTFADQFAVESGAA